MKRFLLAIALGIACAPLLVCAQSTDEEVFKGEVTRWGDTVQHIAGDERSKQRRGDEADIMGVPADDNHKWFISIVGSKGCAPCARLRADIRADQATQKNLGAFITLMDGDEMHSDPKSSWSHYNYFLAEDKTQAFRFEKLGIKAYPTIIVQPPLNKAFGDPATIVYKREGYDGDPAKLVKEISAAIKLYVQKQQERKDGGATKAAAARHALPAPARSEISGAFGQNDIGVDPPFVPTPRVDPTPVPNVLPPQIPPPDAKPTPAPKPDATPDVPVDAKDLPPEAVIVYDKNAIASEEQARRLDRVVEKLRAAGKILRVRQIDYRDAPELDVPRDQLPAVVVTAEGRVLDRLTDRLLPFVSEEPKEIGLADVPWNVIWTLITGGGIGVGGAVALLLFAVKAFRAFRLSQGKAPLLSDEQLAQLRAQFETWFKPREPAK